MPYPTLNSNPFAKDLQRLQNQKISMPPIKNGGLTFGNSRTNFGNTLGKSAGWVNAGAQVLNGINAMSGGATNKTGNFLTTAGGMIGSIPTPYTAAIGAVMSAAGAVANGFTDDVNTEYQKSVGSRIGDIADITSNATDYTGLMQDYNTLGSANFDVGDIENWGSKGFLVSDQYSERAKAREAALEAKKNALMTASANINTQAQNINQNNMYNLYSRLRACGGKLGKRHDFGGDLMTNGAVWDTGMTFVGNGGSHEQNPYEGVQMGVDAQGIPNLVEEGEVIWNDYVFSKRLKVPKSFRESQKIKKDDISFAEAAEIFNDKERPNDPISKRTRDARLSLLMDTQEDVRMKKQAREAKAQFNALSPEEQLGIMQAAQQQAAMGSPEDEIIYNGGYPQQGIPMEGEEALMAACGGRIAHKHADGDYLKYWTSKSDIETNLPWLRNLYVKDNDTSAWDAIFDANNNIIATKGGNTGLYDPNGAYMQALNSSLGADNWNKWSDAQKQGFVDNLKKINPGRYANYTVNNVGTGNWSWDKLRGWATDGMVGGHHQVAQFASQITPPAKPEGSPGIDKKLGQRVYLTTKDNGVSSTALFNDIPYYEGISKETGLDWNSALKEKGYVSYGKPQISTENGVEYTDRFIRPLVTSKPEEPAKQILTMPYKEKQTISRYAPVLGAGIGIFTDAMGWTNNPDFGDAQAIADAYNGIIPPTIEASLLGDYVNKHQFDRNFYLTQARGKAASTDRALLNAGNGNIGATYTGLLGNAYNTIENEGRLGRQAEEFLMNEELQRKTFNRATNQYNADNILKARMANAQFAMDAAKTRATGLTAAAQMRANERNVSNASRTANVTNFLQSLGDIGNENMQKNWLRALYSTGYFGTSPQMERSLYNDKTVFDNFMYNNPDLTDLDEISSKTGISKKKVKKLMTKRNKNK